MSLKKLFISCAIAATIAGSTGFINPSVASAQYRRTWQGRSWYDRQRERDELYRIAESSKRETHAVPCSLSSSESDGA